MQIGVQRQRQMNGIFVKDPHRLAQAAQSRMKIIAVPEKTDALPAFRHRFILALQVAAGPDIRGIRRLGNAAGNIARAGIVRGNGNHVFSGIIQKTGHVKSERSHAHFVIPGQNAVDIQVAGLPHALECEDDPLARMLRRHPQPVAIESAGTPLPAPAVLNRGGKQIRSVEGMRQRDLLPARIVIDPVHRKMAGFVPAGRQCLFHGKDIGQPEPPAPVIIAAVTHLHPSDRRRIQDTAAVPAPRAGRFHWLRKH